MFYPRGVEALRTRGLMLHAPCPSPLIIFSRSRGSRPAAGVECAAAGGRWTFDWKAMEAVMVEHPEVALFMLCNPYNPVGESVRAILSRRRGARCSMACSGMTDGPCALCFMQPKSTFFLFFFYAVLGLEG